MIKQLQLRGISRVPSDRMSADGGCAESLNVHLDQGETAPTLPPVDISAKVYPATLPSGEIPYKIVFIHKMRSITNYVGYDEVGRYFRAYGTTLVDSRTENSQSVSYSGISFMGGAQIPSGETLRHVTSIGNTLICYSGSSPYYFLYKDGNYTFLGTEIPKLDVEFATSTVTTEEFIVDNVAVGESTIGNPNTNWNDAYAEEGQDHDAIVMTIMSMWEKIKIKKDEYRHDGKFVAPFFLRYALKLYDGKYIYVSSPILCGGGVSADWVTVRDRIITGDANMQNLKVTFNDIFTVNCRCSYSASNWSDIIKSIDFFASEPIYAPAMDVGFGRVDYSSPTKDVILETMDGNVREQTIKDAVLSKGQFYKVDSVAFGTNEMNNLSTGYYQILASDFVSGDNLLTQDELVDGYRDGNQYIPINGSQGFNNRLLLVGANEILTRGYAFLNGQYCDGTYTVTPVQYAFRYKIVDSGTGTSYYVWAHYMNGEKELFPAYFDGTTTPPHVRHWTTSLIANCHPCAWISYPDTRCKEVQVFYKSSGGWNSKIIPMEEHPLLSCAYAFLGFGVELKDASFPVATYSDINAPESRTISASNKLFLSELENPYLFPAGNIITFHDPLVGAATTSVPLSEGQFGEFPMYIFTEGGIRVLVTTSEGTFAANMTHPNLSRHVALPNTIFSMEQAVVFITERGVMMLTGGSIKELSHEMNGKPYVMDTEIQGSSLSTNAIWGDLIAPTVDTATFMGFMRKARIAYDFNGARLIFIYKPDAQELPKPFCYEYRLETNSWHKLAISLKDFAILNSYPDCYVSYDPHAMPKLPTVFDFSTALSDASILSDTPGASNTPPQPTPGIIVTRPFTLGEPDIRKAIRSIRVRGRFNRDDVQYILLGSFDNIHWHWMKSLRGGSYKTFRIILLTNLMAMERITWIDVDYESRFTNRLR